MTAPGIVALIFVLVVAGAFVLVVRRRGWPPDAAVDLVPTGARRAWVPPCFLLVAAGAGMVSSSAGRVPYLLLGVVTVLSGLAVAVSIEWRRRRTDGE